MAKYAPNTTEGRVEAGSRLTSGAAGGLALYKVRLSNGREKRAERGQLETDDFIVDASGNAILRIDYDERNEERQLYRLDGRKETLIKSGSEASGAGSIFTVHGLSQDQSYALATAILDDTRGIYPLSLEDGSFGPAAYLDPDYDIGSVQYDYDTGAVIGVTVTREFPQTVYFDAAFSGLSDQMKKALGSDAISLVSFSRDRNIWIVKAYYSDRSAAFYLFDKGRRELSEIASEYPMA